MNDPNITDFCLTLHQLGIISNHTEYLQVRDRLIDWYWYYDHQALIKAGIKVNNHGS